jgi:predicted lipoprotein
MRTLRQAGERDRGDSVRRAGLALALVALLPVVSACKVIPITADRAARERQAGSFDATRYVDAVWDAQAAPYWDKQARPLGQLTKSIDLNLDAAGAADGRKAGDGSPWTFVTHGEGQVVAVKTQARAGAVTIDVSGEPVDVLIGPVVSGSALRDSLPFVTFNDFSNQIAFAEVGGALTKRALRQARPAAEGLKPGDRVRFQGVFQLGKAGDPVIVTPVRLERVGA